MAGLQAPPTGRFYKGFLSVRRLIRHPGQDWFGLWQGFVHVTDVPDAVDMGGNARPNVFGWFAKLPKWREAGNVIQRTRRVQITVKPRWYNAITTNCTTGIRKQHPPHERLPWDWRILFNGKGDEMLYKRHLIVTDGLPFVELKTRSVISDMNPYQKSSHSASVQRYDGWL